MDLELMENSDVFDIVKSSSDNYQLVRRLIESEQILPPRMLPKVLSVVLEEIVYGSPFISVTYLKEYCDHVIDRAFNEKEDEKSLSAANSAGGGGS